MSDITELTNSLCELTIIADPESRYLQYRRPDLYREIDKDKHNDVILPEITFGMHKKLWWNCPKNPCGCHKWEAAVKDRVRGNGCPFCSGHKTCQHFSFMSINKLACEFDYSLNPNIDPYKISKGSITQILWKCNNHKTCNEHVWYASPNNRTNSRTNCPFCYGDNVCKCNTFMNIQLLADEFISELNPGINPYKFSLGSGIQIKWKCLKHNSCDEHVWITSVYSRGCGTGCPFCSIPCKQVCKCNTFMNNPFLTSLRNEYDFNHPENLILDPYKLSIMSNIKCWWKCSICHSSWEAVISNRSRGNGCPKCAFIRTESKGEIRCREYLEFLQVIIFSQCKLNYIPSRKYDFGFGDNLLIEIDGKQHFNFTEHWHKKYEIFRDQQQIDKIKTLIPILLNINILRVSNDNEEHIKHCIDFYIKIKLNTNYCDIQLIIFDDITKYWHLIDNCNSNLIKKVCDVNYHEEIINKFRETTFIIVDIKTMVIREKIFYMDDADGI